VVVLDRMVVRLLSAARPGEDYVVMAKADPEPTADGRLGARVAVHCRTGRLVATAHTTWHLVPR